MTSDAALAPYRKKLPTPLAAQYCGLGKSTFDKFRLVGGGPAYIKIGSRVVYDVDDLDAWLDQHKRASTSEIPASVRA